MPHSSTSRAPAKPAKPRLGVASRHPIGAAPTRRVFCVPRRELASHVTDLVKVFVDAEREQAHSVIDSELIDRLGTSYATVAELVVQLMERQRQLVRLRRELERLRRVVPETGVSGAEPPSGVSGAEPPAAAIGRPATPVNG